MNLTLALIDPHMVSSKFFLSYFDYLLDLNNDSFMPKSDGAQRTRRSNQAIISIGLISTLILTTLRPITSNALSAAPDMYEFILAQGALVVSN